MKKNEIEVGVTYHNGKAGRFYQERKVVNEGWEFTLYDGQENADCIRYDTVKKGEKEVSKPSGNMTRQAFAAWAKGRVGEETENA